MPVSCFCSVPLCSNSKQKQPYLSFHSFPAEEELRKKWVIAIRRSEGPNFKILRNSTHVCSAHFEPQDIYVTPKGKTWLKKGAIPHRFSWTRQKTKPTPTPCLTCFTSDFTLNLSTSVLEQVAWYDSTCREKRKSKRERERERDTHTHTL
uniref:THAP domain-containing protein 1 n=1 Tax=Astyanax mexicanus TaxID=7994 RepID=A0A8B9GYE8_ASTMX